MQRTTRCLSLAALTAAAGCAPSALPVRHVVIYRNGVAYFERGGHVAQDQVRFKMKATGVGDLLATMAVTDRAGGHVGAASFPVRAVDLDASAGDRPDRGNSAETVVLSLDGKAHDLAVGYIAESPVWKPSYRLVVHAGGTASLQIWGIVQNFSGEDWKGVALSLVAGAPIAYSSDLASPVTPSRPMVSDHGQEPIAVPRSEASYGYRDESLGAYRAQRNQLSQAMSSGQVVAEETVVRTASDAEIRARQARLIAHSAEGARLGGLTSDVVVQAGTTRYDLPQTLSIADQSASMVMVLDQVVAGEVVLLFAPDAAVADSATRPFRAVRFENSTGGALEPGPVAMFEEGSFLGQAVTEPLVAGATGTVPFALERGVSVSREARTDEASGPLTAGIAGELTIERERVTRGAVRIRRASLPPWGGASRSWTTSSPRSRRSSTEPCARFAWRSEAPAQLCARGDVTVSSTLAYVGGAPMTPRSRSIRCIRGSRK